MRESHLFEGLPEGMKPGQRCKFRSGAVYELQFDGSIRRVDKPRMTKKGRRRAKAARAAFEALTVEQLQAIIAEGGA